MCAFGYLDHGCKKMLWTFAWALVSFFVALIRLRRWSKHRLIFHTLLHEVSRDTRHFRKAVLDFFDTFRFELRTESSMV